MKVKNIMFFGAAAVILSAAGAMADNYTMIGNGTASNEAYTSGRTIVASKSYSDLRDDQLKLDINTKQNKIDGDHNGQLVTGSNAAGTVSFTEVASSIDATDASDNSSIPTVGAVEGLVSSATADSVAFDDVIPDKGNCSDTNPCVLMQDADSYNWYSMVTDAQAGGSAVAASEIENPQQ